MRARSGASCASRPPPNSMTRSHQAGILPLLSQMRKRCNHDLQSRHSISDCDAYSSPRGRDPRRHATRRVAERAHSRSRRPRRTRHRCSRTQACATSRSPRSCRRKRCHRWRARTRWCAISERARTRVGGHSCRTAAASSSRSQSGIDALTLTISASDGYSQKNVKTIDRGGDRCAHRHRRRR